MHVCFQILLQSVDFRFLRWRHPELLSQALQRLSENMAMAATQLIEVMNLILYKSRPPAPDLPLGVEIQEALGIYGHRPIDRFLRKLKSTLTKRLGVFLDQLFGPSGPPELLKKIVPRLNTLNFDVKRKW